MRDRSPRIDPEKITRPIQLLAAWLVGLVAVDGAFLTAAVNIAEPQWAPGVLVVSAILNVPLFLAALFLLQTRYRPEMQEDTFYAKYLEHKSKSLREDRPAETVANDGDSNLRALISTTAEMMSETHVELQRVSDQIAALERAPRDDATLKDTLHRLEEIVSSTKERVTQESSRLDWARVAIQVNKKLAVYRTILERFAAASVQVSEPFGSNVPARFQLSLGLGVTADQIRWLVSHLADLGLELIEYDPDPNYGGRVYVGSYAFEFGSVGAEFDTDLRDALTDESTSLNEMIALISPRAQ